METRVLVRAIVYDEQQGDPRYLLLRTRKGYWQNPQGGINPGEGELEALLRETREETGLSALSVVLATRSSIEYDTEKEGNLVHARVAAYAIRANSTTKVRLSPEDGHTESRWVSYDEALHLLTEYPEQRQVFEEVVRKIKPEIKS